MYFLSKLKRQVVILDLVRAPLSKTDTRFAKNKVSRDIKKEVKILEESEHDVWLLKFIIPRCWVRLSLKK